MRRINLVNFNLCILTIKFKRKLPLRDTAWPALFANNMGRHAARMRVMAMFPNINALPGAEGRLATNDGNAEVHRGQRRANVRRHVVLALARVLKQRVAIGNQPRKKSLQIAAHFRVGIFLDQQRRGGMAQVQREQAILNADFLDPRNEVRVIS